MPVLAIEFQPRDPPEGVVAPIQSVADKHDPCAPHAIKSIIADFLARSNYRWGTTPQDLELRAAVAAEALSWDTCGNVSLVEKIVDCACDFIESAYGHLSPTHRRYVAIYTACFLFCDDLGGQRLEAVRQFATCLTRGQPQLTPALDTLAGLLRKAHELWPAVGADAIISGTIDAMTGMYLEYTTQDMVINQRTTWWPTYLRTRTGVNAPFIHFIFMKSFRATPESYLQLLPYMEHYIGYANDVLSFYKEELAGETKNYIHIRAQAEGLLPIDVFRHLAQEVLDSARTIELTLADDEELKAVWLSYLEKFIEFHVNAKRYKLAELLS